MTNPYQPNDSGTASNPKKSKGLNNLYRNSKQMVMLTILGILIPILLLFAAPLGIVYAFQRSKLLKEIDSGEFSPAPSEMEMVAYLRGNSVRYYLPSIIVVFAVLFVVAVVNFM